MIVLKDKCFWSCVNCKGYTFKKSEKSKIYLYIFLIYFLSINIYIHFKLYLLNLSGLA